jgi:hypothetical protein
MADIVNSLTQIRASLAYSEKKLAIGETLTDVWRLKKVNSPLHKRGMNE